MTKASKNKASNKSDTNDVAEALRIITIATKKYPIDVTIAEDFTDLTEGVDDDMLDQAEDTITIINKYVDGIKEDHIDNDKLKSVLKELYVEALNLEQA